MSTCYRPTLADNPTFDVCCFDNAECAEKANGTQYCYGWADLMNQSYTTLQNATCGNTGFQCTVGKQSHHSPSTSSTTSSSANTHTLHPTLLGIWTIGLWVLARFSKN
ncbi:hypothetical protein L486_02701 [Kwoniella mangroviensis CBS 10435]|uniref:Uncharacterized protein n=1 Tax=Kwoniella mangroviensis CBS 10435 TaxID=1331196 RepID=A0A1B9IWY1_9TREE|nr:hypothetical protein L486_02701 [Kwoniella mangroviensis CBS 10435]